MKSKTIPKDCRRMYDYTQPHAPLHYIEYLEPTNNKRLAHTKYSVIISKVNTVYDNVIQ